MRNVQLPNLYRLPDGSMVAKPRRRRWLRNKHRADGKARRFLIWQSEGNQHFGDLWRMWMRTTLTTESCDGLL
jgi:hypothetical protein